jgi:mRNA interferase YafQ
MLIPATSTAFDKDFKRLIVKGKKNPEKLEYVMTKLQNEELLEEKYKDHKLSGGWFGRRECHIEPDLLLIYKIIKPEILFERMGSHSDLFK